MEMQIEACSVVSILSIKIDEGMGKEVYCSSQLLNIRIDLCRYSLNNMHIIPKEKMELQIMLQANFWIKRKRFCFFNGNVKKKNTLIQNIPKRITQFVTGIAKGRDYFRKKGIQYIFHKILYGKIKSNIKLDNFFNKIFIIITK